MDTRQRREGISDGESAYRFFNSGRDEDRCLRPSMRTIDEQIQKNYEAYINGLQAEMEQTHLGKTLLMHDEEIIDMFEDPGMAYRRGYEDFGLGQFTLITVGEKPVELGVMSIALA